MSEPAAGREQDTAAEPVTYAVPLWLVALMAAGALGAAYVALTTEDAGRFMFAVAAAAAAFEAGRALVLRPTLVANAAGFAVAVGLHRERHPWSAVVAVGTLQARGSRPRRRANALEIDLGDRLLIVPSYRLGAPSADVADTLNALSARGG